MNCQIRYSFRRIWLVVVLILSCCKTYAYDFEVDGLYYKIISDTRVEITYREFKDQGYSGKLLIPEKVNYNGKEYVVASIGYAAFYKCSGLTGSLAIPSSITSIGSYAFSGCTGLMGLLNLPGSITAIGSYAFSECSGLTGSLVIPNSVTSIGKWAFHNCKGFDGTLSLPNSLVSIEEDSFGGCNGLTGSITIPNGVKTIGGSAFVDCSGFTGSLTIPNTVTSIGDFSFAGCSGLSGSLAIPNSVTSIGNAAFQDCWGFTGSLSIPNSITSIGSAVFNQCTGFSGSLIIPSTITTIGRSAFSGCFGLSGSLSIQNSVTSISDDAFNNCLGLTSLTIPNSLTTIGKGAFRNCQNILLVDSKIINPFAIEDDVFYKISSSAKLQVPKGTKVIYQEISGWVANFEEIVESDASPTTYTLSVTSKGNGYVSFEDIIIRSNTNDFTVNEGASATISFSPDAGYRIKSVKVNGASVTISNNEYTISSISGNTTVEIEFEAIPQTTYALTIDVSGKGYVTYDGTQIRNYVRSFTVKSGSSATLSIFPDDGWRVKSLKVNDRDVTSSVSNNQYTINSIQEATKAEVIFEEIVTTHTLKVKATGNGTASYDGTTIRNSTKSFSVKSNQSPSIAFSPDEGYRRKSVMVNNTDVTSSVSNNQYTLSRFTDDTTVEVEFEVIAYTISIVSKGSGKVTYNNSDIRSTTKDFIVTEGGSISLSFTPDSGYRIKSLKVNGLESKSSIVNSRYSISNIYSDISIEVEFEKIPTQCTLTIKSKGNGTTSYDGSDIRDGSNSFSIDKGAIVIISIIPDSGYKVKSLKVNGDIETASVFDGQYTIDSMDSNTEVEVEYESQSVATCVLTIDVSGRGSVTYEGVTIRNYIRHFNINQGSAVKLSIEPDEGYIISSLSIDGVNVTSNVVNSQYTISNVTANTSISIVFGESVATTYSLSIKAIGNGSVSFNNTTVRNETKDFTINQGSSVGISFSPDNGYRIKSVKVNKSTVTVSNNQYTVSNINANTTVSVEFEAIPPTTYTLSITSRGLGSVFYNGETIRFNTYSYEVEAGSSAKLTFTPDDGYRLKSVIVNNAEVSVSNNQYTISNINQNTTVEVGFEEIPITTYTLSITASGNGSASYDGTTIRGKTTSFTVDEGTSAKITFSPDDGYRIKSVKVNNSTVSVSNNQYTVSNIKANTTVSVEFEAIPVTTYTLSIAASGNGSASYDGTTIRGKTSSFTVNQGT
ncbi:MAG: leucine-rich repeat domain-containing protein, partial [Prevotella sp.]|nr:leucine-rich repeat domain-containing protein [Prevotella sp.]